MKCAIQNTCPEFPRCRCGGSAKTQRIELDLTDAEIIQLRQIMDWLPLARYATLICAVNKQLPLESDAASPSNGADGATRPVSECAESGGFSLRALTPKGERLLPEVARIMGQLEVDL